MRLIRWISTAIIRLAARLLLRVETVGVQRIPASGPVILAINHVNFIDAPLLYTILPRETIGLAKAEIWENPLLGLVARSWSAIPVRRGELDLAAFRQALQVLREGKMLGLAPEGTRSHHGRLLRGRPGVVHLALRVPDVLIVPMAIYGHADYAQNWRRLHRTPVKLVFGHGFYLKPQVGPLTHAIRQKMTDEIMLQIAALLPPEYRGAYSDLGTATEDYLQFPPGATSNLRITSHQHDTRPAGENPSPLPGSSGKGVRACPEPCPEERRGSQRDGGKD